MTKNVKPHKKSINNYYNQAYKEQSSNYFVVLEKFGEETIVSNEFEILPKGEKEQVVIGKKKNGNFCGVKNNKIIWEKSGKYFYRIKDYCENGLAHFFSKNTQGFINQKGEIVIEKEFDNDYDFGFFKFFSNDGYIFYKRKGIIKQNKNIFNSNSNENTIVIGIMDTSGNILIEADYEKTELPQNLYSMLYQYGKKSSNLFSKCGLMPFKRYGDSMDTSFYGFINKSGEIIYQNEAKNIISFFTHDIELEGVAKVTTQEDEKNIYTYIDKNGKEVFKTDKYDIIEPFINDKAFFKKGEKIGFLDKNFKVIFESTIYEDFISQNLDIANNEFIFSLKTGGIVILDNNFQVIKELKDFKRVGPIFANKHYFKKKNGNIGFLDENYNIIYEPDQIKDIIVGYSRLDYLELKAKYCFLNGTTIHKDNIKKFKEDQLKLIGNIIVEFKNNKGFGVLNQNFEIIYKYENIESLEYIHDGYTGYIFHNKDGSFGVLNNDGEIIAEENNPNYFHLFTEKYFNDGTCFDMRELELMLEIGFLGYIDGILF